MTKTNTKEPSPDELYKKLEEMNLAFEVVESFEGVRVINFLVDEYKKEQIPRQQMINALTEDEMWFLANNPDKHNVAELTDFFANGGFNAYTDTKLAETYDLKHGED